MWLAIYIIIALFVFPIWQSFYNYNRRKKIQKEYDALKYKYESLLKESNSVGNRLPINKFIEEKRTGFIPVDIQENVWKRDGGKCVKCGSSERLEYDHIIPLYNGGANTERNLQILCEHCGKEKSKKLK